MKISSTAVKTMVIMIAVSFLLRGTASHAFFTCTLRDDYGVPHIYSPTIGGLFYGLGYAVAQDRLYQLEIFKRAYQGRLSQVLGSLYLFPDQMFLKAGYSEEELEAFYDELDEEYKTVLKAFTDGINLFIQEALADRQNKLPYEFHKNGFDPVEWTPLDVVLYCSQMQKRPYGGYEDTCAEILAYLLETHGEVAGRQIFDDLVFNEDPAAPTSVPTALGSHPSFPGNQVPGPHKVNSLPLKNIRKIARVIDQERMKFKEYCQVLAIPQGEDCFGLAISPSRSASGNPIFLGGPQMDHSVPSGFYEVGLHGPGIEAVGTILSGIPAIAFGHTQSIAFTFTAGLGNSEDIFVETLNPTNHNQYWHNAQWKEMTIRTESIPVKNSSPVEYQIKSTVHGPVIATDEESHLAYTVQWNNRQNPLNLFIAYYEAMRAPSVAAYQAAVNMLPLLTNFLYADTEGNIGYFHVGNYPVRSSEIDERLPTPGTGEYDWQGAMADEDKPFCINPAQGYLTNWNNKPQGGWHQGDAVIKHPWGVDDRVYRFTELMAAKDSFSFEDLADIVYDIAMKDLHAPLFKTFLLEAESEEVVDTRITLAKQYLEQWDDYQVDLDGDGFYDSIGLTIWDAWWDTVIRNTFEDELGSYFSYVCESKRAGAPLFLRALQGSDATLPPSRDYFNGHKNEVLLNSLVEALDTLEEEYGTADMSQWKREIETQPFSPSFMSLPISEGTVEIIPIFMNRGVTEHMVELSWPFPQGVNIVPPGESGFIDANQNKSLYFADQINLYVNWEYKKMHFTLGEVLWNLRSLNVLWYW